MNRKPEDELTDAIVSCDIGAIRAALAAGAETTRSNSAGDSPLQVAARNSSKEILHYLIERCFPEIFNPEPIGNPKNPYFQMSALEIAVRAFHSPLTEALLELGEDPNSRNRRGMTPLHLAARWSPEIIAILLAFGADQRTTYRAKWGASSQSVTPLDVALRYRNPVNVALLLRAALRDGFQAPPPQREQAELLRKEPFIARGQSKDFTFFTECLLLLLSAGLPVEELNRISMGFVARYLHSAPLRAPAEVGLENLAPSAEFLERYCHDWSNLTSIAASDWRG